MPDKIQDQRSIGQLRDGRKKRWFDVENDLIDRDDLDIYEKMAYIVIARHTNADDQAFPSYTTISNKGRMSRRKAIDAVKGLLDKGLIIKEIRRNDENNLNQSNLYTLLSAVINEIPPISPSSSQISEGSAQGALGGGAPHALGVVHSMHQGGAHGAPEVYLFNNTNILSNNLSISPSSIKTKGTTDPKESPNQNEKIKDLKEREIDGDEHPTSNKSSGDFQRILFNAQLEYCEDPLAAEQALRLLFFSNKALETNNIRIPPAQVRLDLLRVNIDAVNAAFEDFNQQSKNQLIKNPVAYLSKCIYNAIWHSKIKLGAAMNYDGLSL